MVAHDVGVVGKSHLADCALAVLGHILFVQQLSYFRIQTDFEVSSRVVGIVSSVDSHLAHSFGL